MRLVRPALVCFAALVLTGTVQARSEAVPAAPQGLKAFLLRADEPAGREFPRTPSFAWAPVRAATRYEFELAKNPSFSEGAIFWSSAQLKVPAASVPLALPWLTGNPYAVYARVRAITTSGVTAWSTPYGFNVRWSSIPQKLPDVPGLSRWTPVEGASYYQVWWVDVFPGKIVATKTPAVDQREFWSFHPEPSFTATVRWRVRAVRNLYGAIPSGLPAVSQGPWSPVYTSVNPALAGGAVTPTGTYGDGTGANAADPAVHRSTPAFAFSGNASAGGTVHELYRVYAFSDADCVNVIYRGAMVGSPAYAPRMTGPLKLPKSNSELTKSRSGVLGDGPEPPSFTADGLKIQTTESDKPKATPVPKAEPAKGEPDTAASEEGDPASTPPAADPDLPATPALTGAPVDLWESGWPNGRFYWTVVPVRFIVPDTVPLQLTAAAAAGATTIVLDSATIPAGAAVIGTGAAAENVTILSNIGSTATLTAPLARSHAVGVTVTPTSGGLNYYDVETPQDVCASGRVLAFGKASEPAVSRASTPYVSGLSPRGRLTAAARSVPSFYGTPLIAWKPAVGADQYQVQWSKRSYPWKTEGERLTYATSALLPLGPGRWFYRIRGINFSMPGTARAMTWSDPIELRVTKPTFAVVKKTGR
ncbi:MAG: hypothetical protein ACYC1P_09070 [Gaiellaceae bacterium]